MIDNIDQVELLITRMRERLPLSAALAPEVAVVIREQRPGRDLPKQWRITRVDYAGDEGGIMCRLDAGEGGAEAAIHTSITQLRFSAGSPLAREIAAYQKHRVKRLRKLGVMSVPLREHKRTPL